MEKKLIDLEALADGAFAERTRQAIKEVMRNIADPNTEWKTKRKVTIDITFEAREDREVIECDVVAKPKLAPKKGIHTKFLLDKNLDGEVIASEFKKQIPGQQTIKVDSETGEMITPEEKSEENEVTKVKGLEVVK